MKEYRVVRIHSTELGREVRVFIMLPDSYYKNNRFYPVLYMHDGQNLFDPKQSYGNVSWGVLEAYEGNPDMPEVIIVGIENGGDERSNELVPFQFNFADLGSPEMGDETIGGNTDDYMGFITTQVKPFIDKTFRTFKSPRNTGIMGSSFGGVCSTYAALSYSDYFGRFGCVSNAYYYIQDDMEKLIDDSDLSTVKKFYMDVGTNESSSKENNERYIKSNREIYNKLKDKIEPSKIRFEIIEDAIHHESAWSNRFPDIIKFLFND